MSKPAPKPPDEAPPLFVAASLASAAPTVTIDFEGEPVVARQGATVAATVLCTSAGHACRVTPRRGLPRTPYCLMGVCYECLMEIDGVPDQRACMTIVREGMRVRRQPRLVEPPHPQSGASSAAPEDDDGR